MVPPAFPVEVVGAALSPRDQEQLAPHNNRSRLVIVLVFVLMFVLGLFLMKSLQSALAGSTLRLGIDLYPRWVGSEAVLNGQSPYSLETRRHIWQAIYGSTSQPDGNPFGFYYPPSIATLLIPFILLGFSIDSAAVLWSAFLWASWTTVLLVVIVQPPRGVDRRSLPLLLSVLLLIGGLLFRPAFANYVLGQYSLFSVLMLVAAWVSHQHKKDILVGIFASLSLTKPALTVVPVAIFMIFYARSLKSYLSFGLTSILLYLPPTLLLGWWVPDFLEDLSRYTLENRVSWSVGDIETIAGILWLMLSVYLIVSGLLRNDGVLVLSASLALGMIFFPHTADYDLVALVCLLFWLASRWLWLERPLWPLQCAFLILILFPWASLFAFIQVGLPLAVERWYRFIWLVYPVMILLSVSATWYLECKTRLPAASDQLPSIDASLS